MNGINQVGSRLASADWAKANLAKWLLVIPMFLLIIYFGFIAENRYVSESKLVVFKNGENSANLGGIALPILGNLSNASQDDARYLVEYIYSAEMFDLLDKEIGLRQAFALHGLDVFYMLPTWVSKEYALDYYRNRLSVSVDDRTGILTIQTQGFSPEFALRFNQAIMKAAERFINELSYRVAREQLDFASQEVSRARKGLESVRDSLLPYQEKRVDPVSAVGMTGQIVSSLEGSLASKEAELRAALGMMQESAPQVVAMRHTIAALRDQIRVEKAKLSSTEGERLNRRAVDYLDQKAMVDFQADIYRVTLSAFEKTRVDTVRKIKNLVVIAAPQLPERAEFPRRIYSLVASLFLLVMAYGFVRLAVAVVEDHRD